MSDPDNSIPAFPLDTRQLYRHSDGAETTIGTIYHGMSLRDWFAGMAIQGILASPKDLPNDETLASWAYQQADKMLKAREQ